MQDELKPEKRPRGWDYWLLAAALWAIVFFLSAAVLLWQVNGIIATLRR